MLELLQFSKLMTLWKRKKKTFGGQGTQQGGFEPRHAQSFIIDTPSNKPSETNFFYSSASHGL
jgi:hypothetical protein